MASVLSKIVIARHITIFKPLRLIPEYRDWSVVARRVPRLPDSLAPCFDRGMAEVACEAAKVAYKEKIGDLQSAGASDSWRGSAATCFRSDQHQDSGTARRVEDRLTAIRRRADNCPCAVWQPAPSVAGRQRWGIRAGRERRLAIRSRRAHKAIIIIAAEGRIQPVRHSTRYL